jgi:hypothetical protein
MEINLQDNEVATLLTALGQYISGLREEIGKTENYDYREDLKEQLATLNGVITKLGGSAPSTGSPNLGAKNPPWGKS